MEGRGLNDELQGDIFADSMATNYLRNVGPCGASVVAAAVVRQGSASGRGWRAHTVR